MLLQGTEGHEGGMRVWFLPLIILLLLQLLLQLLLLQLLLLLQG